jgi:hypothetical protein
MKSIELPRKGRITIRTFSIRVVKNNPNDSDLDLHRSFDRFVQDLDSHRGLNDGEDVRIHHISIIERKSQRLWIILYEEFSMNPPANADAKIPPQTISKLIKIRIEVEDVNSCSRSMRQRILA